MLGGGVVAGGVEAGVVIVPGEDAGVVIVLPDGVVLPDGLVAVPGLPGCVDAGAVTVPGLEEAGAEVLLPAVPGVPDTPALPVAVPLDDGDVMLPGVEVELGGLTVLPALPETPPFTVPLGFAAPTFWPMELPLTTISTRRFN